MQDAKTSKSRACAGPVGPLPLTLHAGFGSIKITHMFNSHKYMVKDTVSTSMRAIAITLAVFRIAEWHRRD